MKKILSVFCFCCFGLAALLALTAETARAEVAMRLLNNSPVELNLVRMVSDSSRISMTVNAVPGTDCGISSGDATKLISLYVQAAAKLYTFENINLPPDKCQLAFSLNEEGLPVLAQQDNADETVTGTVHELADEAKAVDFASVLAAPNMGALREMGMKEGPEALDWQLLSVRFGDVVWAANIKENDDGEWFSRPSNERPLEGAILYGPCEGPEIMGAILGGMIDMNLRPWHMAASDETDEDNQETWTFFSEGADSEPDEAWGTIEEVLSQLPDLGMPVALEITFVNADAWNSLMAEELPETAMYRLRFSNGANALVQWLQDGSTLLNFIRAQASQS